MAPASIHGHQFTTGLDTMASHCLLPKKLFRKISSKYKTQQHKLILQTSSGTLTSTRYLRAPITIEASFLSRPLTVWAQFHEGGTLPLINLQTLVSSGLLKAMASQFDDNLSGLSDKPTSAHTVSKELDGSLPTAPENPDLQVHPASDPINPTDSLPKVLNDLEGGLIHKLLLQYRSIFPEKLPSTPMKAEPMKIILSGKRPTYSRRRRFSKAQVAEIRKEIRKLLEAGVIQPSRSYTACNPLLVRKPDGSWRFCCDFTGLNKLIESCA